MREKRSSSNIKLKDEFLDRPTSKVLTKTKSALFENKVSVTKVWVENPFEKNWRDKQTNRNGSSDKRRQKAGS